MPAEVFKLVVDNSNFKQGLKESEAQAAASTSAITSSLQKIEGGATAGSKCDIAGTAGAERDGGRATDGDRAPIRNREGAGTRGTYVESARDAP